MNKLQIPEGHCQISWSLPDLFSQQFKGPFTAVADDGETKLPPVLRHGLIIKQSDPTNPIDPSATTPGGKVIDSEGAVVVTAKNYMVAHVIAYALNMYPTSLSNLRLLGMPPHGPNHVSQASPWDYWVIKINLETAHFPDPTKVKPTKTGGISSDGTEIRECYVAAFNAGEFRPPSFPNSPFFANKYATRRGAENAIELIKKIVKRQCIIEHLKKLNGKPFWDTMVPVRVHYLHVVADPNEGTRIRFSDGKYVRERLKDPDK